MRGSDKRREGMRGKEREREIERCRDGRREGVLGKERKYCPLSPLTTIIEVDPACRIRLRLPDTPAISGHGR